MNTLGLKPKQLLNSNTVLFFQIWISITSVDDHILINFNIPHTFIMYFKLLTGFGQNKFMHIDLTEKNYVYNIFK